MAQPHSTRRNRRDKGLCLNCAIGLPPNSVFVRCKSCRAKEAQRSRTYKAKMRKQGKKASPRKSRRKTPNKEENISKVNTMMGYVHSALYPGIL